MEYVTSLIDLVGNTPLVQLSRVTGDAKPLVLAKVEYLNPGGSVKDRIAVKMIEAAEREGTAEAWRHHRRADQRQHRGGTGHRRAGPGLPLRLRLPGQGERGQAERAGRVRGAGGRLPDRGRARPSRLLLLGLRPAGPRDRRARGSRTSTPTRTTRPATTSRPARRSGAQTDGRITHFVAGIGTGGTISGTGRYLKDVSEGRVQVIGADPVGLGLLRRQRSAVPGRGRRRGLLAGQLRPEVCDRGDRGLRRRLLRHDPPAGPRGGAAGRRLLRDGRGRRDPGGRASSTTRTR